MKSVKIPFINCNLEFGVPLIILISSISSIWINNVFFLSLRKTFDFRKYDDENSWFYNSFCLTHLLIVVATSYTLYTGIKKSDRFYLRFWLGLRIVELGLTIGSTILLIFGSIICTPVGLVLLGVTIYLILCVKKAYVEINQPASDETNNEITSNDDNFKNTNPKNLIYNNMPELHNSKIMNI